VDGPPRKDPLECFWRHVDKNGPGGCWLWTGALDSNGYGRFGTWFGDDHRTVGAHVYAYLISVGPIPDGLELDHVYDRGCHHKHCCNPLHLEPVTHSENVRRAWAVGGRYSSKTHCPQGHEYNAENTLYRGPNKRKRFCRVCNRERMRRHRASSRSRTP
jgi:hypothetical protein